VLVSALVGDAAFPTRAEAGPDASDTDAARRARTAVTVGSRKVTVGELEDRLAGIPPFQLATFGGSKDAVVRAFVEQVLVRDLVLAEGAQTRGLDKEVPTKQLVERSLSSATLRHARGALTSAAAIPEADVARYYDENRSRFDSPERINVWRILAKTRDEAVSVIDAAKRDSSVAKWTDLARDHSIDKATNMRGGNLGFLAPDGSSNEAGVKVDPAIVKAAQAVKDGEIAAQPVSEGTAFAVVWRRGTVAANRRSVAEASAQIRAALFRERTETAEKKLIADLRAKEVKEVNEGLLGLVELRPFDAGLSLPRATTLPSSRPPSPTVPPSARRAPP
jgi:peptidyl-prolyl cis-trans isomerase C